MSAIVQQHPRRALGRSVVAPRSAAGTKVVPTPEHIAARARAWRSGAPSSTKRTPEPHARRRQRAQRSPSPPVDDAATSSSSSTAPPRSHRSLRISADSPPAHPQRTSHTPAPASSSRLTSKPPSPGAPGSPSSHYFGEVCLGKRHGYGRCVLADGSVYEGEWCNDRRDGHGTYRWPGGERVYVGSWRAGVKHGAGSYWERGIRYDGEWLHGKQLALRLSDAGGEPAARGVDGLEVASLAVAARVLPRMEDARRSRSRSRRSSTGSSKKNKNSNGNGSGSSGNSGGGRGSSAGSCGRERGWWDDDSDDAQPCLAVTGVADGLGVDAAFWDVSRRARRASLDSNSQTAAPPAVGAGDGDDWTPSEALALGRAVAMLGCHWSAVAALVQTRTPRACRAFFASRGAALGAALADSSSDDGRASDDGAARATRDDRVALQARIAASLARAQLGARGAAGSDESDAGADESDAGADESDAGDDVAYSKAALISSGSSSHASVLRSGLDSLSSASASPAHAHAAPVAAADSVAAQLAQSGWYSLRDAEDAPVAHVARVLPLVMLLRAQPGAPVPPPTAVAAALADAANALSLQLDGGGLSGRQIRALAPRLAADCCALGAGAGAGVMLHAADASAALAALAGPLSLSQVEAELEDWGGLADVCHATLAALVTCECGAAPALPFAAALAAARDACDAGAREGDALAAALLRALATDGLAESDAATYERLAAAMGAEPLLSAASGWDEWESAVGAAAAALESASARGRTELGAPAGALSAVRRARHTRNLLLAGGERPPPLPLVLALTAGLTIPQPAARPVHAACLALLAVRLRWAARLAHHTRESTGARAASWAVPPATQLLAVMHSLARGDVADSRA